MTMSRALTLLALAGAAGAAHCPYDGEFDASTDLFTAKTVVNHAVGWSVEYHKFYKVATVGDQKYQMVHCNSNTTEFAKAVAALPECTLASKCRRFTTPVHDVAVMGNEVVGFLEELGELGTVKFVSSAPVSACLQAKAPKVTSALTADEKTSLDAIFDTAATGDSTDASRVVLSRLHSETQPLAKLEWIEFVSLFYNQEGLANYVLARSQTAYDSLSHLTKALSDTAKLVWITNIDTNARRVTFTGDQYIRKLAQDMKAEVSQFGQTLDMTDAPYYVAMKAADAIVLADGMRYSDVSEVLSKLRIPAADVQQYKALDYVNQRDYMLLQADKFVTEGQVASGRLGNDWEEHVSSAPDLLLSDLIKATRGTDATTREAPWVYLRNVANSPIVVKASADACKAFGAHRPSSIKQVRLAAVAGLQKADGNPTVGIASYSPHTDYFPSKVDPFHAEDFDIEYHLTWKVVRDTRNNLYYVLLMKGAPEAALPSPYVLGGAKRFYIPVSTTGYSSTPTAPLLVHLGAMDTIKIAESTPMSCILKGTEDGLIKNKWSASDDEIKALDVYFAEPAQKGRDNVVVVQQTSDPGPLNRAEWLYFISAWLNAEDAAATTFAEMEKNYMCVMEKGKKATQVSGRAPSAVAISSVFGESGKFFATQAQYMADLVRAAGGVPAAVEKSHPFYKAGNVSDYFGSPILKFDSSAQLLEALKLVDVVIDDGYHAGANSGNPVTLEMVKQFYGMPEDTSAYPFMVNKALFRQDKRQDAIGYLDQFCRGVSEPDAFAEDYMTAFHPDWRGAPETYFLRNMIRGDTVDAESSDKCDNYYGAIRPLTRRTGVCDVACSERTNEAYCKQGCLWTEDSTCIVLPTTPIPQNTVIVYVPASAAGVAPAVLMVLLAAMAQLL